MISVHFSPLFVVAAAFIADEKGAAGLQHTPNLAEAAAAEVRAEIDRSSKKAVTASNQSAREDHIHHAALQDRTASLRDGGLIQRAFFALSTLTGEKTDTMPFTLPFPHLFHRAAFTGIGFPALRNRSPALLRPAEEPEIEAPTLQWNRGQYSSSVTMSCPPSPSGLAGILKNDTAHLQFF
ncbi:MAG: hypothetical protein V8R27_01715 [Oscillospiraceae bacterium]